MCAVAVCVWLCVCVCVQGMVEEYDQACADVAAAKEAFTEYLSVQRTELRCSKLKYFHSNKDRYQIEVPEEVLSRNQPDDYELTSRRKGFRRFWTPEIKDMLETLKEAEARQKLMVKEQMRLVFAKFDKYRSVWSVASDCIANVDAILAMARWSAQGDGQGAMCRPVFVEPSDDVKPFLHLHNARHPGIANTFTSGSFIPNDTFLGQDPAAEAGSAAAAVTAPCVLITGPNMGGKSTMLRQTCCSVILAQMVCQSCARVGLGLPLVVRCGAHVVVPRGVGVLAWPTGMLRTRGGLPLDTSGSHLHTRGRLRPYACGPEYLLRGAHGDVGHPEEQHTALAGHLGRAGWVQERLRYPVSRIHLTHRVLCAVCAFQGEAHPHSTATPLRTL